MKFLRCPLCLQENELEPFPGFSYCHACNGIQPGAAHRSGNAGAILHGTEKAQRPYWYRHPVLRGFSPRHFTDRDYEVVRDALLCVPKRSRQIVVMHFWKNLALEEIAERMELDRETILWILNSAYARLRRICTENPQFSRFVAMTEADQAA